MEKKILVTVHLVDWCLENEVDIRNYTNYSGATLLYEDYMPFTVSIDGEVVLEDNSGEVDFEWTLKTITKTLCAVIKAHWVDVVYEID